MIDPRLSEQQLIHEFLETLQGLPDVRATLRPEQAKPGRTEFDAQIDLKVAGKSIMLLAEAKKSSYPRDVHQAIWQLRKASQGLNLNREIMLVVLSEYLSPGAKELLQAERVGYFDSGGSLYLPSMGAYFYVDKPPAKAVERSVRSLFSGRRAQVLHALLTQSDRWFGVHELAELAMVSPATASEVLAELERMDWATTQGKGPQKERQLSQPATLLDAWVKEVKRSPSPRMARYYVPGAKFDELIARISQELSKGSIEYAVTSEAAAQLYAPFLSSISQVRVKMINTSDSQAALHDLGARAVTEGSNLAIIDVESRGELLFRNLINNIWLASPVQVYLDLQRGEGRSTEMAEHLRKERIGF